MQNKPTVKIKDAYMVGYNLMGVVLDYPDEHQAYVGALENGKEVTTSRVISVEGNIVETQRTIYEVQNWLRDPADDINFNKVFA